jgi:hypothetical protein
VLGVRIPPGLPKDITEILNNGTITKKKETERKEKEKGEFPRGFIGSGYK